MTIPMILPILLPIMPPMMLPIMTHTHQGELGHVAWAVRGRPEARPAAFWPGQGRSGLGSGRSSVFPSPSLAAGDPPDRVGTWNIGAAATIGARSTESLSSPTRSLGRPLFGRHFDGSNFGPTTDDTLHPHPLCVEIHLSCPAGGAKSLPTSSQIGRTSADFGACSPGPHRRCRQRRRAGSCIRRRRWEDLGGAAAAALRLCHDAPPLEAQLQQLAGQGPAVEAPAGGARLCGTSLTLQHCVDANCA